MRLSTQGSQVAVERREQILHQSLKWRFLLTRQQAAFIRTAQEVPCLVERATRYAEKAFVIYRRSSPISFGDIGADAIGGTDDLVSYGGASEWIPADRRTPDEIREFLGHRINLETFESELGHRGDSFGGPSDR